MFDTPTPSEWIPGTVLERDPDPPVCRPWTPEPVVEPHNGPMRSQAHPETPVPDESFEGTVVERSPEPRTVRPGTPEGLTISPGWETFSQQASPAESGKPNEDTSFLIEDPKYHLGFIGEEPRLIRQSSSRSAHNSAASEAVPQATFPTWSYASVSSNPGSEDEGWGRQIATSVPTQSTPAPISPTRSPPGSLSSTYIFRGLPDHRSASRSSNRITDGSDQDIASGRARANSSKTPTGALRQSTLDEYFERLSLAVLQTSSPSRSVLPTVDIPPTREGSSGSGNDGGGGGGQFTATGHGRPASAETSSASGSAVLTPSGSSDTSSDNSSDNAATLPLRHAQSSLEYGRTPATFAAL
ncbi:hypothetical protein KC336_g17354 [Hortaea werneckii]|nr:hypothetical protein KC336_g17354 [Hortaea werneckii]